MAIGMVAGRMVVRWWNGVVCAVLGRGGGGMRGVECRGPRVC